MRLRLLFAALVVLVSAAILRADDANGLEALKAAAANGCPCGPLCEPGCPCGCAKEGIKTEALPHAPVEKRNGRTALPPSAALAALWARGVRDGEKVVIGLNCDAPLSSEWTAIPASETDGFRPGSAIMVYIASGGSLHGGYRLPEDASQSEIRKMLEKVAEPTSPSPQLIQQQPQVIYMQQPMNYGSSSFGFGGAVGVGGCVGGSCGR